MDTIYAKACCIKTMGPDLHIKITKKKTTEHRFFFIIGFIKYYFTKIVNDILVKREDKV